MFQPPMQHRRQQRQGVDQNIETLFFHGAADGENAQRVFRIAAVARCAFNMCRRKTKRIDAVIGERNFPRLGCQRGELVPRRQ